MISKSSGKNEEACLNKQQLLDYSFHQLNKETQFEIENHLLICDLCSNAVEGLTLYKDRGASESDLDDLENRFKINNTKGYINKSNWKIYISSAAVLLICIASVFILSNESENEKLFNHYFKPYPNIIPLTRGEYYESSLNRAVNLYNSRDYSSASLLFSQIFENDTTDFIAGFYAGISFLCENKPLMAIKYLKQISLSDNILRAQSKWYLGLSYIRAGLYSEAKNIFIQVSSEENYYRDRAKVILHVLDEF